MKHFNVTANLFFGHISFLRAMQECRHWTLKVNHKTMTEYFLKFLDSTGRPQKKCLSEFSSRSDRNILLGHFDCFWPVWTKSAILGHSGAFWAFLVYLGHYGLFGLFWAFWACFGPFEPFWAVLGHSWPIFGYFAILGLWAPNGPERTKMTQKAKNGLNGPEWSKGPRMAQKGPKGSV